MGPSQYSLTLSLSLAIFLTLTSSSYYAKLVFKSCTYQNLNAFHKQTIEYLLGNLTARSFAAKFYKTTSSDGAASASASVDGLFQCRGDLSNDDCRRCVEEASAMAAQNPCKDEAAAARIQLDGCHLRYEISKLRLGSGTHDLVYKICGSDRAIGAGFEEKLELALGRIVEGLGSGGGFYAGGYQLVYVLGQCEGDLSSMDCVSCVKNATDRAKSECGNSISAQVYLQQCYISYAYYPNGVPTNPNQSPSGTGGEHTQKTVAIALGVLMGSGMVIICVLCLISGYKRKPHILKYGG